MAPPLDPEEEWWAALIYLVTWYLWIQAIAEHQERIIILVLNAFTCRLLCAIPVSSEGFITVLHSYKALVPQMVLVEAQRLIHMSRVTHY